jgi:hypothetical protein
MRRRQPIVHRDADHTVPRCEAADVIEERLPAWRTLVAAHKAAAGDEDEHRAPLERPGQRKDIEPLPLIGAVFAIARDLQALRQRRLKFAANSALVTPNRSIVSSAPRTASF